MSYICMVKSCHSFVLNNYTLDLPGNIKILNIGFCQKHFEIVNSRSYPIPITLSEHYTLAIDLVNIPEYPEKFQEFKMKVELVEE